MVCLSCSINGHAEGLRCWSTTPTVVGKLDSHHHGIVEGPDGIRCGTAVGSKKFQRHDLGVPIDPGNSNPVVPNRSNGSGTVGTVTVIIHRIRIVIGKVISVNVVHVAIFVIIETVTGNFAAVDPHVIAQIGMVVIHTGIKDRNDGSTCSGERIPRFWRVDIRVGHTACLARVVHAVKHWECLIIRDLGRTNNSVSFR